MKLPEYVTREEVQRVCQELEFRDWTKLSSTAVTVEETRILQNEVGEEALQISVEAFKNGLEVELEHGLEYNSSNITNNIGGSWYPTYDQISNHDETPIIVTNSVIGDEVIE